MSQSAKPAGGLSQTKRELLARLMQREGIGAQRVESIAPAARAASCPLSFAQQRLWFMHQLEPASPAYNLPSAVRLAGSLDRAALQQTLDEVVRRHEILRTCFALVEGQPAQVISTALPLSLPSVDVSHLPEAERETEVRRLISQEAQRPFDLSSAPLLRATLLRLKEAEHVLLLTMHHIVSDGWSMGVLVREVAALYEAFTQGRPSPLAELKIQYADYAVWQRERLQGQVLEQQLNYWKEQLSGGLPVLELPLDRRRAQRQSFRGAQQWLKLPVQLQASLKELSRREGVTLFMTLLAAFQTLLARYTGESLITVGSPIANRTRPELEELIGFFVNTLVLRTNVGGNPRFKELLQRVREMCLGAYAHQDVPFEKLVEELQPERSLGHQPLFQVVFALQNTPMSNLEVAGLELTQMEADSNTAKFDLVLNMLDTDSGLVGSLKYNTDLFDAETIERMLGHFHTLLEAIIADPAQPLNQLPLLREPERHQLLSEWNRTATDYPHEQCIHEMFAAQAGRTPEAVALVLEEQTLSYAELNRRANQLAHYLRGQGVGAESLVGLMMERSIEMVVAVLGILKAGAAYLPLDPAYPQERLAWMMDDAQVSVLLTQAHLADLLAGRQVSLICLDTEWKKIARESESNPINGTTALNLAYVTYTSGSTGRPKGVCVPHRGVVRLVKRTNYVRLDAEETLLQFAPIAFDASTFEIWGALLNGARLAIMASAKPSLKELGTALRRYGVTTLWLTANLFQLMVDEQLEDLKTLRQLLAGGDVLPVPQVRRVLEEAPGVTLINGYGPTENTTFTCCHPMTEQSAVGASVSIGRPISNTQIYLLDRHLQPVPVNLPAQLYIGGDGLARGYLNRPELTAQKFIPHPFSQSPGARLYQTGDLARFLPDGTVEFLGRVDQQVKIRGFRIELGEVEAALLQHSAVREAVVVAREQPRGDKQLVAYLVPQRERALEVSEVRRSLQERLPLYMVPTAFVLLDELPLSANGKVERRELPEPADMRAGVDGGYEAPGTQVEELLCGIWSEVLGVEGVGVSDNFFELGGHSLLGTQIMARVRATLGIEMGLATLFERPAIREFAEEVERALGVGGERSEGRIERAESFGARELSYGQQRLWFLDQLEPGNPLYNIPSVVHLRGHLRLDALERSLNEVVRRHESLRTSFALVDEQPVQIIAPAEPVTLPVFNLESLTEPEREAEAQRLAGVEAQKGFDLESGPLWRASILRLDETEHVLLLTMHHIVSDGWSMGVLVREVAALYRAFCEGRVSPLPEPAIQYADFAAWQRERLSGETLEQQLSYWRRQLSGELAALDLPTDRARPALPSGRGRRQPFKIERELTASLKALGQHEGVTLFMTLLAAFQVLLARYTGQEDIAVGTPIANRTRPELEELIGFFVNTLVLRMDLSGDPDFRGLLHRVREVTLGAYAHQDVPFEKLVEELQPERDTGRSPLFQVMLILQNTPVETLELPALSLHPLDTYSGRAKFDLVLNLHETAQGLEGAVEYSTDLFDAGTIERMLVHFQLVLQNIAANPGQKLSQVSLLGDAERRQILEEWGIVDNYRREQCLHQMFEAEVERNPHALALSFQNQLLSYAELNARSNRLAHALCGGGLRPRQRVAICLDSGPAQVIALLATLKAGACFICLDPHHPASRLRQILDEVAPAVLISESVCLDAHATLFRELPDETDCKLVLMDDSSFLREPGGMAEVMAEAQDGPDWLENYPTENPSAPVSPQDLAYIVYTSGSTGRPKGIMQSHRSFCQFVKWMSGQFGIEAGKRIAQWASITYDAAYAEIFSTLCAGATLCLTTSENKGNPLAVFHWVRSEQIALLQTVPSFCRQLLQAIEAEDETEGEGREDDALAHLEWMLLAGEVLPVSLARTWLERFPAGPKLCNLYGPTETVLATYHVLEEVWEEQRSVSIGRAIDGRQVLILDQHQQLCPVGIAGEIYICSPYLTVGYFGREEESRKKYVPNPLPQATTERAYRTGDVGRWLADGQIEFLGRVDHQVKIRGIRVELEEIEAALFRHPSVQESAVVAQTYGDGEQRLVAYVSATEDLTAPLLREFMEEMLPDYLVPAVFVFLDKLARTPSGKVDREALPRPDERLREMADEYVAPRTSLEIEIAGVWQDLLRVERAGLKDNFFHLGGHSLLAAQVVNKLRQMYDVELSLLGFIEAPTIVNLAQRIETACHVGHDNFAEIASVLERVKALSDDEVRSLLEQA
jgi:amino acid adenylation domain-containing protein